MVSFSNMSPMLVIGDFHETFVKRYCDVDEKSVKYYYKDSKKNREEHLDMLSGVITDKFDTFQNADFLKKCVDDYYKIKSLDDFFYHVQLSKDCYVDEESFDSFITHNKNAKYSFFSNCEEKFIKLGGIQELAFVYPFHLKNGDITYSAKKGDIDWEVMNCVSRDEEYRRIWALIKETCKPETEYEQEIFDFFKQRENYINGFEGEDSFVYHHTCFWYNSVIDMYGEYHGAEKLDEKTKTIWKKEFYERYVADANDDMLFTLYEIKLV